MRVKFDEEDQRIPIKYWLPKKQLIESGAWEQALHMSKLPFAFKHIAIMPDVHKGYGVPIGGVMALKDIVIPHAVGVDISCGVQAAELDVPASILQEVETGSGKLGKMIGGQIMRNVPLGFEKHNKPQFDHEPPEDFFRYISDVEINPDTWGYDQLAGQDEFENATYQLGTLGSGNHFVELQEDLETGHLWLMVHSGSRHLGYAIAKLFDKKAQELNERWYTSVPEDWDLAFLPPCHKVGQAYIHWMHFASDFALMNRRKIFDEALKVIKKNFKREIGREPLLIQSRMDCNHNYLNLEHHFGKDVFVHRKGAIRTKASEQGIIPGSMGSYSYIIIGKGEDDTFNSASHGAGRRMSRNQAKKDFDVQDMIEDFKKDNIFLFTKGNKEEVLDEYKKAYKSIENVVEWEEDLIEIKNKLKTVCVIKG